MPLSPPCPSIPFEIDDVYGAPIRLENYRGKRVMLAFFRDAACPFCNLRVYELTQKYKEWQAHNKKQNWEIIAVFSSPAEQVRKFVAQYPRPFRLISDDSLSLYQRYEVEESGSALLKALLFKLPRIIKGMIKGGRPKPNPHVTLVPADFLINELGKIERVHYGKNTSDHMPMPQVERFILAG